jgi:hypothetical protein
MNLIIISIIFTLIARNFIRFIVPTIQCNNTVFAEHNFVLLLSSIPVHSLYGATAPFGTWRTSEDISIFLYLLLVSPILHSCDLRCVTQDYVAKLVFWGFPLIFFQQSKILHDTLKLKLHLSDGIFLMIIICQDMCNSCEHISQNYPENPQIILCKIWHLLAKPLEVFKQKQFSTKTA